MEQFGEAQVRQARKDEELTTDLHAPKLQTVDTDQFAMSLNEPGLEANCVANGLLGGSEAIIPQVDLAGQQSGLGGHVMIVRYLRQLRQCLLGLHASDRELGEEHVILGSRWPQVAQARHGLLDPIDPSGPEVGLSLLPEGLGLETLPTNCAVTPNSQHRHGQCQSESCQRPRRRRWNASQLANRPERSGRLLECFHLGCDAIGKRTSSRGSRDDRPGSPGGPAER